MRTLSNILPRLLAVTLTSALLMSVIVPVFQARPSPVQDQKRRKLQKTGASDAVALLAYLLDRYVENPANKTELDRKLSGALSRIQDSRSIARRLVENFRKIPLAERQAVFGKYGDLRSQDSVPVAEIKAAFKRAIESAPRVGTVDKQPKPDDFPAPQNPSQKRIRSEGSTQPKLGSVEDDRSYTHPFAIEENLPGWQLIPASFPRISNFSPYQRGYELQFRGIYCVHETYSDRGSDSDEIYVVTSVVDTSTGETTTMDHPRGRPPYYEDVDEGEKRDGPVRAIWSGTPANLAMFVVVREQDEGDPRLFRDSLGTIVSAAYHLSEDTTIIPPVSLIMLLVGGIIEISTQFLDAVFGPGDDTIDMDGFSIGAEQLREFATHALNSVRNRPLHHFYSIHTNRDMEARYFVMYGVQGSITEAPGPRVVPPPIAFPDLVVSRFIEAGRAKLQDGEIYLPVKIDVKNSGVFAAGVFKVEIRIKDSTGRIYSVPLTVVGSADARFPASSAPLAPGATLTFEGVVKISARERGRRVMLHAVADTCADAGLSAPCRVRESDESNNASVPITVELP